MTNSRTTDLALLAVAFVWGTSYLAAKDVVEPDSVFAFLVLRFGVATLALGILLAPRLRQLSRDEVTLGAMFGVILGIILTFETFGVTKTSASNAGLIISLTIVITPLLEQRVRRTRLPRSFYAASAVAVGGVALLTQTSGFAAPGIGDLLILLAAVARAVHIVVIAHSSEGRVLDSARLTFVQLLTALALFAVLSQFTGNSAVQVATEMDPPGWLLTVYLALGCTVLAFCVQTWAVRRTSSARVSLLLGTEPVWAAVCGVVLGGDPLTALGVVGALLILCGTSWGRVVESTSNFSARSAPIKAVVSQ